MRTNRWLKALACGFCFAAGADAAYAQAPLTDGGGNWVTADGSPAAPPYGGGGYGAPYPTGGPPGTFQPPMANNDPSALWPSGAPEGYSPWPTISPYGMGNYGVDEHYNSGGTWFRQILNKRRDYFFGIDALGVVGKAPGHATVGARTMKLDNMTQGLTGYTIKTYGDGPVPGGGGTNTTGASTTPSDRLFIDTGVFPYAVLFETGDVNPVPVEDNTIFPIRNFSMFSEFRSTGAQMNWGFFDESGGGFQAIAWIGGVDSNTFQRGNDTINNIQLTQPIIINQNGLMLYSKNGAVPFDTGIPVTIAPAGDVPGQTGGVIGTQKYDVMYRLNVWQQTGGGDLQFLMNDLTHTNSGIRLRPVYSAKYIWLGEGFEFKGVDSGLSYTLDGEDGGTTGGNNATAPTFRPTGPPFTINNDLFTTIVKTTTQSHMVGPTAGIRYDLGSKKSFHLWGQTSAGLLANVQKVQVSGVNAGETVGTEFVTGTNMLEGDSSFRDSQNTVHLSPMLETSINADSRILAALPGIKEIDFLAAANLRVGYTHTIVGAVARPYQSTHWYGFPSSPKVDVKYQNWYVGRFNLGLEWNW
jgi:hypothetical protein